ncbi:MAG TPA: aspartate-semialdehyde dehydrogenase [Gammaproteobacteria bacterium]|nr:aspartate-semialdehyde dehydrogenase 2 [bacterium BMS3Abin11]HDH15520.1 aspartate-semialdehyde dehydrogenase [Gammaproteobacteria bacterium]HDZ78388.1 aspartate-semialdehyde dehydrogenase [Gammaproteobacteria bacterium]
MTKVFDIAVVGATGAVGETMLRVLHERNFPVGKVYPLASSRSAGRRVDFGGKMLVVEDLNSFDFSKVQIGLFSAGGNISKKYAPRAVEAGCVVVDNTSYYRYDDDIPLVVPEVNPQAIADYKTRGIIANPNCSTIQMLVALKPIYDEVGISRINVCTYQAVSGTGKQAIEELAGQSAALLGGKSIEARVYPKQIAFNVLPQIDLFEDNGYTREEMKMVWETRKIFSDDSIMVNPTAVRVPVFYGHSEAIHIETHRKISAAHARELLISTEGIIVVDERLDGGYPTAVTEGADTDPVYVGRIRKDISHPMGLNLWVVADNVRKGAATNSIQIAEILAKSYL